MSGFKETDKLWGGRFNAGTDALVEAFTASVAFDKRLAACDVQGSVAHVRMLAKVGVLTDSESKQIIKGLEEIATDIARG
ncbi:MAG: lyase family protein, partial [Gammaproteobacteria bacterium]